MKPELPALHELPGAVGVSTSLAPTEPPARVGAEALEAAYRPKARGCVTHCVESVPEVCQ